MLPRVLHLSAGLMWGLMTTKRACKEDAFITKAHGVLVCVCVCVIVCVCARECRYKIFSAPRISDFLGWRY